MNTLTLEKNEQRVNGRQSEDILTINEELIKILHSGHGIIDEMCSRLIDGGGKRLRPLLVLYSGLLFSGPREMLLQAAAAMELVHMASLVHDDIIDESDFRRNQPSINKLWGDKSAVLGGDFLFAKAFGVLTENQLFRNLGLTVEAIQEMCQGEITQAQARFNLDLGVDHYFKRIAQKTAVLLRCSCQSGAIIAGAGEIQIEKIGAYGLKLGVAFQIVDDILDFYGDSQVMGKPKHEDLVQGNITLPILFLLNHPEHGPWIKDLIERRNFQAAELERVDLMLVESGIIQKSFAIATAYIEEAKQSLGGLPENGYRDFLMEKAEQLKKRAQ